MTKQELLKKLADLETLGDIEVAHADADDLLIEYISDPDIKAAYEAVPKWYA